MSARGHPRGLILPHSANPTRSNFRERQVLALLWGYGLDLRCLAKERCSLDFISAKVQTGIDRNANAKRSVFPFPKLS
jgi:hypothetical protein